MPHARMKTAFLQFSNYLPWSIFLLLQLLENLVFVEFPYITNYRTKNKAKKTGESILLEDE